MRAGLSILLLWMALVPSTARALCGPAGAPDATFYQPLAIHGQRGPEEWDAFGQALVQAGIRTLYAQWSILDGIALFPLSESVNQEIYAKHITMAKFLPLPGLLAMAERRGIGVWIGLDLDPAFFQAHARNPDLLRIYFLRRELALKALLPDLEMLVRSSPAFQGWYITDEIDDLNWQDKARKTLLIEHFAKITGLLASLTETPVPVAISGFSNGRTSPSVLAEFWNSVLEESHIDRLLFQDSVGAGKLSVQESRLYRDALAKKLGTRLHMVVETFSMQKQNQDGNTFVGIPATATEMNDRLALAMGAHAGRPVLFSAPEYLLPSDTRDIRQSGNISPADRDRRAKTLYHLQADTARRCPVALSGTRGAHSR